MKSSTAYAGIGTGRGSGAAAATAFQRRTGSLKVGQPRPWMGNSGLRVGGLMRSVELRVVAGRTMGNGKGKYAGQVGALVVEREDGRRFRLGSGLSDRERASPPPIGSWVTYHYNGYTSTGLPRFARFVRIREDMHGLAGGASESSGQVF